jgi:DNA repair protein RAD51
MHHFRTEFNGRGELSVRQISLGRYLKQLQKLADEFGVAVLVTNQVMAKVDGGFGFGDNKLPIGGHILAHAVSTRISLSKLSGEQRKAKLTDSPSLPESDCVF